MTSRSFLERVALIKRNQKCEEFYTKAFSRHVSPYISAAASLCSLSPNALTLFMVVLCLVGCGFIMVGSYFFYFVGGGFLLLINVVDTADGELARYLNVASVRGDYLDRMVHYVTNSMTIIAVGVGISNQLNTSWPLYIAIVTEIVYTLDEIARDLIVACGLEKARNSSRKQMKLNSRLPVSGPILLIGKHVTTNTAFFHLFPVFALVDWMILENLPNQGKLSGICIIYCLLFSAVHSFKLCARVFRIKQTYFS